MASDSKAHKVYISVGSNGNPQQEAFATAVRSFIEGEGLETVTVGRNYFKNQEPLRAVTDCLRECCGLAVIAFERTYIQSGTERRGSAKQQEISGAASSTV